MAPTSDTGWLRRLSSIRPQSRKPLHAPADDAQVPTHRDMPDGFHDVAKQRQVEVDAAAERALAARRSSGKSGELSARQRADDERRATSIPPPS